MGSIDLVLVFQILLLVVGMGILGWGGFTARKWLARTLRKTRAERKGNSEKLGRVADALEGIEWALRKRGSADSPIFVGSVDPISGEPLRSEMGDGSEVAPVGGAEGRNQTDRWAARSDRDLGDLWPGDAEKLIPALPGGSREFTQDSAQAAFRDFVLEGTGLGPEVPLELVSVLHGGASQGSYVDPAEQQFRDYNGVGQFLRVSQKGGKTGFLFPHPHARFDSYVHQRFFPLLTEGTFNQKTRLAEITPLPVGKVSEGLWKITT